MARTTITTLQAATCLPALIRKAHEAKLRGDKELVVWGSGRPRREFLHVDDMADACVFLMEAGVESGLYNIGTGQDIPIRALAETVMEVVGLEGASSSTPASRTARRASCSTSAA